MIRNVLTCVIHSARQVLLSSSILLQDASTGKPCWVPLPSLRSSCVRCTSTFTVVKQDTDDRGLTGTRFRRRNEDYLQQGWASCDGRGINAPAPRQPRELENEYMNIYIYIYVCEN